MQDDPFDLKRFQVAQMPVFETAIKELRAGRKQSHWMWFVFPQLRGLGHSANAERYGIASLEEARAYLAQPVLGKRLEFATEIVLSQDPKAVRDVFGTPDDLKFHSCMSLFDVADGSAFSCFRSALTRWFDGKPDAGTARLLGL
ncbi:DUF1810 domain-containing protein [Cereibacter sphaeroides]|uniref:DUF1810 domain-containing protein n=1 Tax=Rhodobacterales TaxID=204455 RepID=UPI000BBE3E6E|nr:MULTISPECIES: DUF1810 domain-containing protein [Paracoccaceae]MCE6950093.1 DUF1810 domain-containing protein [Cereibacter sphaeroides]MCE6958191.1 DUF1810 domain-containing protein [Cereibacter sphaeroides]MCE6967670.1 DUF1810 domain-containing protein [Cereibacter sphaeroides]MCE6972481.1 DUF1810 domain-containing protein [Cereibacter sphaeroides]